MDAVGITSPECMLKLVLLLDGWIRKWNCFSSMIMISFNYHLLLFSFISKIFHYFEVNFHFLRRSISMNMFEEQKKSIYFSITLPDTSIIWSIIMKYDRYYWFIDCKMWSTVPKQRYINSSDIALFFSVIFGVIVSYSCF